MRAIGLTVLVLGVALHSSSPVKADTLGNFTEYSLSGSTANPNDVVEGPDGNLWVTEEGGAKISKLTTAGSRTSYTLPNTITAPNHISRGHDGKLWFTGLNNSGGHNYNFGKVDTSGSFTIYEINHSTYPGLSSSIVPGPDGFMYMGLNHTTASTALHYVAKIDPSTGEVKDTVVLDGHITELVPDYANNLVWFIVQEKSGTSFTGNRLVGKISADGSNTSYTAPAGLGTLSGVTIGPDGNVWFTASQNTVGKVTLNGTFNTYTVSGSNNGIWRIATGIDGYLWATLYDTNRVVRIDTSGNSTQYTLPGGGGRPKGIAAGSDGNMWFVQTDHDQLAKIGTGITSTSTDADSDSLNAGLELSQGTSDLDKDTDNDGLDDYLESSGYPSRDDIFCGAQCAYPDPLQKDLYIEMDWMVKSGAGGYSTQPSSQHLTPLVSALAAKSIIAHIDTGNFGGGNEVPYNSSILFDSPTTSVVDYYDYKLGGDTISEQFDNEDRFKVWRYMLFADYIASPNSNASGIAESGDDDSMIAIGKLKDTFSGSTLDTKISQTIVHELGHNLCLSKIERYDSQADQCIYSNIDNSLAPADYESSMNITLSILDFSEGFNVPDDNDDWSAIRLGIDDFILTEAQGGSNDIMEVETLKKVKTADGKVKVKFGHKSFRLKHSSHRDL